MEEFKHPASGEVLDEQGEFGKGERKQMVELIDESGALADNGLEPARDLTHGAEFERLRRNAGRPLGESEAGGGAGLHGIGLLAAEERGAVVLVALRIAARDRHGDSGRLRAGSPDRVQEVQQVVGVLPGGVESDDELDAPVALGDAFEALAETAVPCGRFGELEFVGGRLKVVAQEGGVVAVAGRVDADAEASSRLRGGRGLW